jgi:hypothetical protein
MPHIVPFRVWIWKVEAHDAESRVSSFRTGGRSLTHPHGGEARNWEGIVGVTHRPVYRRQDSVLLAPCVPSESSQTDPITVCIDQRPAKVSVLITLRSVLELLWTLFPINFDDALLMKPPTPLLHACLPRQKTEPRDHEYKSKSYFF